MCAVPVGGNPSGEVVTSDGTSELVRRDPVTLEPRAVVHVRCDGRRVRWLNDLTWAGGLVWANVARHRRASPASTSGTGAVTDVVDASAAGERHRHPQMLMNGIAALVSRASSCSPARAGGRSGTSGSSPTATEARWSAARGSALLTARPRPPAARAAWRGRTAA